MNGISSDALGLGGGVASAQEVASLPVMPIGSAVNTKIAKMKKLNIFSAANRKDRKHSNNSPLASPPGDTIHRIVSKKEEVKYYLI